MPSGTFAMIIKMSLVTLLYVGVTFLLWRNVKDRKLSVGDRIAIGVLYGILSIFSTHFGIDYGEMLLNVRDMGPLSAGLFFDPVSGIIAGVIGGIERYIAGTYFDVGAYTCIACSISTCLAGFLAAFINIYIFKGGKPSVPYAFFMGAFIEVFHMYSLFVTHRDDMEKAFYVVRVCAVPMILFCAVGLALTACLINFSSIEWRNPLNSESMDKVPVSRRFQAWLFGVTVAVLLLNFGFSFALQTETALQDAKLDLAAASYDIGNSITIIRQRGGHTENYSHYVGLSGTFAVIDENGDLIAGTQYDKYYNDEIAEFLRTRKPREFFTAEVFGEKALCLVRVPSEGLRMFAQIPMIEVYRSRDIQAYETLFADILLFTVIYVLIAMLVQRMVVDDLQKVNKSLNKITDGNLNERVDAYTSLEFASLSDDINETVDVLKGYIDAAENRIEQELLLAHTIQDAALPKNFTFNHKGFEIYASMDPAREVGGDFYDFFFVDKDKLAIVIADVSGKGIPGALLMMRSKTTIRGLAEAGQDLDVVFEKTNNELYAGNDANMFVTVWMGIIDLSSGDMKCFNAGHEYPAVRSRNEDYRLLKDNHSAPLGIMDDLPYKGYEVHFDPGDCLFVYTDGIPEAINEKEEQYGTERMLKTLSDNKDLPVGELLDAVTKDHDAFVGGADQFDDITMVGFRYNGPRKE